MFAGGLGRTHPAPVKQTYYYQRLSAAREEALPAEQRGAIWLPTPRFAIHDGYVRALELLGELDLARQDGSLDAWPEPPTPLFEMLTGGR